MRRHREPSLLREAMTVSRDAREAADRDRERVMLDQQENARRLFLRCVVIIAALAILVAAAWWLVARTSG